MIAVAALAAGCGKTVSDPSGRDGGATPTERGGATSGGVGVGGRATGATGSTGRGASAGNGGNLEDCPRATPTEGDACNALGPCEYDIIDKGCCVEVTTARCIDAVWEVSELDCDCPVDGTGGGTGSADACVENDDCLVTLRACCEPCDVSTADDYVALNRAAVAAYDAAKCSTDAACPPCIALGTRSIVATCNAGRCEVVDLTHAPMTACSTSQDCMTVTRECCECGADVESLVAINPEGRTDLEALVCGPATGCDGCVPTLPSWKAPSCFDGSCGISYVY